MNFLAHAFLSFGDKDLLVGNMVADFVKGRKRLELFPPEIKEGILLHRKIDAFTDQHPATWKAKNILRPDYGLYSADFVDIIFDHFLANDPKFFNDASSLKRFVQEVYAEVGRHEQYLPEAYKPFFDVMRREDWLSNYRNLAGLRQGLQGVSRRARYLETPWEVGFERTMRHYYEMNQFYFELMDDLVPFVKKEQSA